MKEMGAERMLMQAVTSGEIEIDSEGRVWRVAIRTGDRWHRGTYRVLPCARRRAEKRTPAGYLMVRLMVGGHRYCALAHRLVWQALHGDIPDGLVINHLNGLKDDNRPVNLELTTYSGNTKHAYRAGLKDEHGERNPAATLSDHDVGAIRAAYATGGVTMRELAIRFGCSFQHVSRLVRGRRRPKQSGPVLDSDLRHNAIERDHMGRFRAGAYPAEWPEDLRVREWPR